MPANLASSFWERIGWRQRFFQLSEDLSTLRWSWTDYMLVDEIIDVRYSPQKPLYFTILYAHGGLHVQDLREASVSSWAEVEKLLLAGDERERIGVARRVAFLE